MGRPIEDVELQGVLGSPSHKQYKYFITQCADRKEVWGLSVYGADWAMVESDDGTGHFAVWPHQRFAEVCQENGWWQTRSPTALDVHEFVDDLVPRLLRDEVGFAVLPLPDGRYVRVAPRHLRSDLEAELSRLQ